MPVWLVTGGTGFLGRHLLAALREENAWAAGRRCPPEWPAQRFRGMDLDEPESIASVLEAIRPDYVLHAAGRTPPAATPDLYRVNTRGTVHLLSAAQALARRSRIVLAGSAAELGPVPEEELPADESVR